MSEFSIWDKAHDNNHNDIETFFFFWERERQSSSVCVHKIQGFFYSLTWKPDRDGCFGSDVPSGELLLYLLDVHKIRSGCVWTTPASAYARKNKPGPSVSY